MNSTHIFFNPPCRRDYNSADLNFVYFFVRKMSLKCFFFLRAALRLGGYEV